MLLWQLQSTTQTTREKNRQRHTETKREEGETKAMKKVGEKKERVEREYRESLKCMRNSCGVSYNS